MYLKRGLVAGLANLVVSFGIDWLVQQGLPMVALEYQNQAIFRPWADPLMMWYFAYPFILGAVLAYLWDKVKATNPMEFAKLYFLVATIPGMFITYTSFQLSLTLVLLWTLTGFVQAWIAGWVFSKVK